VRRTETVRSYGSPLTDVRLWHGTKVDVDDLIDTQTVAKIVGLAHRNTVSEYQARYEDMPRPVVDLGGGRLKSSFPTFSIVMMCGSRPLTFR
jgi:hypothetical protein